MKPSADAVCAVDNPPEITVVIPCYNAASTLPDQLKSLSEQTGRHRLEVLIVDNGSTDDSAACAMQFASCFKQLRVIRAVEYQTAAYARNEGVQAACAEKVLFCDADDVADTSWVSAMSDALDRYNLVGGGREYQQLNSTWHPYLQKQSEDGTVDCDFHVFGKQQFRHVGAGNMAVRRSVFLEVGGFDPSLKIHEDVDFCVRVQLAGYELNLCPEAIMHIRARSDLRAFFRQGRVWGYWSVALLKKHRALFGRQHILRPLLGWGRLFLRLLFIRNRQDFFKWVYWFGWRLGRLSGSVMMGYAAL